MAMKNLTRIMHKVATSIENSVDALDAMSEKKTSGVSNFLYELDVIQRQQSWKEARGRALATLIELDSKTRYRRDWTEFNRVWDKDLADSLASAEEMRIDSQIKIFIKSL
jgi:hypothetical protein